MRTTSPFLILVGLVLVMLSLASGGGLAAVPAAAPTAGGVPVVVSVLPASGTATPTPPGPTTPATSPPQSTPPPSIPTPTTPPAGPTPTAGGTMPGTGTAGFGGLFWTGVALVVFGVVLLVLGAPRRRGAPA
jgi:hypothetical protein